VKNWNDGKAQEYKERKVYNVATSVLTHSGPKEESCACAETANTSVLADGVYLFASATCPNCKIAEALLTKANVAYTKVLAEENVALTESLKIRQAPTLVSVVNGEIEKFVSVPNIKKFIQATAAVQ